jgi:hypothetical protein
VLNKIYIFFPQQKITKVFFSTVKYGELVNLIATVVSKAFGLVDGSVCVVFWPKQVKALRAIQSD